MKAVIYWSRYLIMWITIKACFFEILNTLPQIHLFCQL